MFGERSLPFFPSPQASEFPLRKVKEKEIFPVVVGT